ncbi:MAG: DUF2726 domain-containing protein [Pseudomonadota bacterium]
MVQELAISSVNDPLDNLSHAEINFFNVLSVVVGDKARVATKVQIQDVLKHTNFSTTNTRVFGDETFDFVLHDNLDHSVLCVIELDDRKAPDRSNAPERSYKKLCSVAGLPLVEVPALCGYDLERLGNTLFKFIDNP